VLATSTTATTAAILAAMGQLLGEGLASLPPNLVKKINDLEYVEKADLFPEAYLLDETAMEAQLQRQRGQSPKFCCGCMFCNICGCPLDGVPFKDTTINGLHGQYRQVP
jgi:hypothetical protein